jgi:hypothetical protein
VQLAIAGPIAFAADVAQPLQQRRQPIEVLEPGWPAVEKLTQRL